MSSILWALIS
jgi:hypothetical protein